MIPRDNLWEASAQEHFTGSLLADGQEVDIAIVGGGFTGCSAALAAAEQGASVALLEAERIGHGGSGRNVGLVNAGLWLPPDAVAETLGDDAGERLNTALGHGPSLVFDLIERHTIACEPVRKGTLHCAHSARAISALESRLKQSRSRGAPVTMLTAAQARARTGTKAVHGALFDARAGTIQPLAYVRGLASAAFKAGAQIHENARVLSVDAQGEGWLLTTPGGTLRARRVLLATNAYHQPINGGNRAATSIVHYFQAATEPIDAPDILPHREGCWDTALVMTSFRRDTVGRLIIGAMGRLETDGGLHLAWLHRKMARLFPALKGAALTRQWSGRISMTQSHLPQLVRSAPGLFSIFGYSGRGIAPGTVMGCAIGQALATGNYANLPLEVTESYHESFCGLRSLWYEAGARLIHLADR